MAFTDTSAVAGLVTDAYDTEVENQNRLLPLLRILPDKHLVSPTHAGDTYTLFKYNDLPESSALLTETTDATAVAVPDVDSVTVGIKEWGRVVQKTKKLDLVSLAQIDPIIVDLLARDQAVSLDDEVAAIAYAGTNVVYGGSATSTVTLTAADVLTADIGRDVVTSLRENAASPRMGELYAAYVHPRVALDLRTETGAGGWRDDHVYAAPDLFWPGQTGTYEGAFYVESARMKVATDGASSAKVYRSLFLGKQALAEVVWQAPGTVIGEVVDQLRRFRPFGWYAAMNWARYREENLFRVETGASTAN